MTIDGGDRACVRLLLELRSRISGLPGGTVIHLIASDPAAPIDLPAWCHLTGHSLCVPRISSADVTSSVALLAVRAVMITGHVPAVHLPPAHAAGLMAAAVPA